jgi:hypothetical protein
MRSGRLQSSAKVYRPTETRNARGATEQAYALVATEWVGVNTLRRSLQNYGTGDMPGGTMEIEGHALANIIARDVIQVVAGPEAGTTWEVHGVTHPGNRSTLAVVTAYNTPLTIAP